MLVDATHGTIHHQSETVAELRRILAEHYAGVAPATVDGGGSRVEARRRPAGSDGSAGGQAIEGAMSFTEAGLGDSRRFGRDCA